MLYSVEDATLLLLGGSAWPALDSMVVVELHSPPIAQESLVSCSTPKVSRVSKSVRIVI